MYAIGKSKVHQRGDYDNGETEKKAKKRGFFTWWAIPRRRQINIKLARPPMKNGRSYHKILKNKLLRRKKDLIFF